MSYEFTKLSGVPAVAEFPEGANAIIETNGEIKRCPSSNTPKPLTYDYMPEGYPSKSVQTTTLMAEQELAFALMGDAGQYVANLTEAFEIVEGQTYTVSWDGTEYECVGAVLNSMSLLGNLSIMGEGADTGEPFLYVYNTKQAAGAFGTTDTAASHTIGVTTTEEIVTPMAEEFLPENLATKSDVAVVRDTAENAQTTAENAQTTADAAQTTANDAKTTAENAQTTANAAATKANPVFTGTFSQNRNANTVIGDYSHAEGFFTTASGKYSHAEGYNTTASGEYSHAEGFFTTASGKYSHSEGYNTTASGESSHAEGIFTTAARDYSHAEGCRTKACSSYQHTQGKYNIEDSSNTYAHIVGNGDSDTSRSNAHTLDWSGNAWFAGTIEGAALIVPSSTEGSTKKFKITVDDSGTLTATEVTV